MTTKTKKKKPSQNKKPAIAPYRHVSGSKTKVGYAYDAECNECDWHGNLNEMEQAEDDDKIDVCPCCGSDNIYYFR